MYINADDNENPPSGKSRRNTRNIRLRIGSDWYRFLSDSGADVSLVHLSTLRRSVPDALLYDIEPLKLQTASSVAITIKYGVRLKVHVSDEKYSANILKWFYVIDHLPMAGIFGADFLFSDAIDSIGKHMLRFRSETPTEIVRVPQILSNIETNFATLCTDDDVLLLTPHTTKMIRVTIYCDEPYNINFIFYLQCAPRWEKLELLTYDVFYSASHKQYVAMICNPTDFSIELEHNDYLGKLTKKINICDERSPEYYQDLIKSYNKMDPIIFPMRTEEQNGFLDQMRLRSLKDMEEDSDMDEDHCEDDDEEAIMKYFRKCTPEEAVNQVNLSHLTKEQQLQARDMLMSVKKGLALSAYDIGHYKGFKVKIELVPGAPAMQQRKFKFPPKMEKKAKIFFREFEKLGIIKRIEAPKGFVANATFIMKTGKKPRLCLDARCINVSTQGRCTNLGGTNEFINRCAGFQWISSIDISNSFFCLELDDESKGVMNFFGVEAHSFWSYQRLTMGWRNSTSFLQMAFADAISGFEDNAFPFVDDLFICSNGSFDDHIRLCKRIIKKITMEKGFKLSAAKIDIAKKELIIVGQQLTLPRDLRMPMEKRELLLNYGKPENRKALARFLNVTHYFAKFLPRFNESTPRLHELARPSNVWRWDEAADQEFIKAKTIIAESLTLTVYDPNKPIICYSDASKYGLSHFLCQVDEKSGVDRAFQCHSKALSGKDSLLSQHKLEVLALYWMIKSHFQLLSGATKVICKVDARALCYAAFTTNTLSTSFRLALLLSEINASVIHTPATQPVMAACDAFNRSRQIGPDVTPLSPDLTELITSRMTLKDKQEFTPEEVQRMLNYCPTLPDPRPNLKRKQSKPSKKKIFTRTSLNIHHTTADSSTVKERRAMKSARKIPRLCTLAAPDYEYNSDDYDSDFESFEDEDLYEYNCLCSATSAKHARKEFSTQVIYPVQTRGQRRSEEEEKRRTEDEIMNTDDVEDQNNEIRNVDLDDIYRRYSTFPPKSKKTSKDNLSNEDMDEIANNIVSGNNQNENRFHDHYEPVNRPSSPRPALGRNPKAKFINVKIHNTGRITHNDLKQLQECDDEYYVLKNKSYSKIIDDLLYVKGKVFIPAAMSLPLIESFHNIAHESKTALFNKLNEIFNIMNLKQITDSVVSKCFICAVSRKTPHTNKGEILRAMEPRSIFYCDLLSGLGREDGRSTLFLSADCNSLYFTAKYIDSKSGESILDGLIQTVFTYGSPKMIVSDSELCTEKVTNFLQKCNVEHYVASSYNHTTNGLIENKVHRLVEALKKSAKHDKAEHLNENLQIVINSLNNEVHHPARVSAHSLFFDGVEHADPRSPIHYTTRTEDIDWIRDVNRAKKSKLVQNRLSKEYKKWANQEPLEIGEYCMMEDLTIRGRHERTKCPKFTGPLVVIAKRSPMDYTVQSLLPPETTYLRHRNQLIKLIWPKEEYSPGVVKSLEDLIKKKRERDENAS